MKTVNAEQVLGLTDFDYLNGNKDDENMPTTVEKEKVERPITGQIRWLTRKRTNWNRTWAAADQSRL